MSRRLPAEWEPQSLVLLTWPRAEGDFAPHLAAVEDNFERLVVALAPFVPIHVNAPPGSADMLARRLARTGVAATRVRLLEVESDDVWTRDHGPITVQTPHGWRHLDFQFNGWGGKFAAARDNRINAHLAMAGALPHPLETVPLVLEGGALESDGHGRLMTTRRCVLSSTRNADMDEARFASVVHTHLGIDEVLWLSHGDLLGDDTDGHIDTLARFCDRDTIAYQACDERADAHHAPLAAMAAELAALRRRDRRPYTLVPLPLPRPIEDADGRRLPAGYANFLVTNGAVLVPTYGDEADAVALSRLREAFPAHQVLGVDCRALIQQYGSLHCVTMQVPAATVIHAAP